MSVLENVESQSVSLPKAFWNAHNGETLKADDPYVRFVFGDLFWSIAAGRQLHTALYAKGGFPSLISDDAFGDMRVVGYGQTANGDEYVDLSFSDDPEDNSFIDGLTHNRFLSSFMAVGVKKIETSDGRSFDLENVQFPEIKPKKRKLG